MIVKAVDDKSTPEYPHPFLSPSWLNFCGASYTIFETRTSVSALSRFSMRGIQVLATPLWALDCGLSCQISTEEYIALTSNWIARSETLKIIDLPPLPENSSLTKASIKVNTPRSFKIQWKHTRQILLDTPLPNNRRKQVKRAEREGITCHLSKDWSNVLSLHHESRIRKEIHSDSFQLSTLLNSVSTMKTSFAVEAVDADGKCIAAGGFVIVNEDTCLYSFGGQSRSKISGIASVAMLSFAMEEARSHGVTTLDFGGSADPGVDRFYKEFGAARVARARLIYASWWLRPFLRFIRPDLG